MRAHPNAAGLGVNWCIFGSSGHITKPEGGVLENFTMRSDDNFHSNRTIKTICDPTRVLVFPNPHYPLCRRGFYNLDENGIPIAAAWTSKVSFQTIRINHYFSKSREEYTAKKSRGRATVNQYRTAKDFEAYDQNLIRDTEILSLV